MTALNCMAYPELIVGGGDALPLHSETYFGNGIKGPLVLRLIKQPSTFYSYN